MFRLDVCPEGVHVPLEHEVNVSSIKNCSLDEWLLFSLTGIDDYDLFTNIGMS